MVCWSQLNRELLCSIAEEKMNLEDYIRCQAVCKNWRLALKESSCCLCRPQLPWLLLPYDDKPRRSSCRGFFNIGEEKVHHLEFPDGYENKRCVGSSHGWLVMVEYTTPVIFLLNPLTKRRIDLPPFTAFPDVLEFRSDIVGKEYVLDFPRDRVGEAYGVIDDEALVTMSLEDMAIVYIHKVVLSCDPISMKDDCIVVAICGDARNTRDLAFCRVGGDNTWTVVPHETKRFLEDVVYWRGEFYAAGDTGRLVVCELDTCFPREKTIIEPSVPLYSYYKYLAVDSVHDQLLLILDDASKPFQVYKLDEEKKVWEKRKDLGDNVLFLGVNYSLCFSSVDFSECKANTIYFARDYVKEFSTDEDTGIFDMHTGVFDMDDHSTKRLVPHSSSIWPPPVWVTPSLTAHP